MFFEKKFSGLGKQGETVILKLYFVALWVKPLKIAVN